MVKGVVIKVLVFGEEKEQRRVNKNSQDEEGTLPEYITQATEDFMLLLVFDKYVWFCYHLNTFLLLLLFDQQILRI